MTHLITYLRAVLRRRLALLAVAVAALLAVPTAAFAGRPVNKPDLSISVTADPAALDIATGQCAGKTLIVQLTNNGVQAVYADATLSAPTALTLQRTMISTYLPAGYTSKIPIPVSAPLDTTPGTYNIEITAASSTATVPVTVTATVPDGSGNLARSASKITASSTHSGYPVCGAVDGDTDSGHWGTTTGWNDGNKGIWPDWFELQWDTPQTVDHITLYTLNSTKYPASSYGLKDWDIQTFTDGQWQTIASVRGNTQGSVTTTFAPVQTTALRVQTLAGNGADDYSRIVELEAFGP